MMGAAAVAVVVVCAVMYTIFEVIERRKRKKVCRGYPALHPEPQGGMDR